MKTQAAKIVEFPDPTVFTVEMAQLALVSLDRKLGISERERVGLTAGGYVGRAWLTDLGRSTLLDGYRAGL